MPYQASDGREPVPGAQNAYYATAQDLQTYRNAETQLANMRLDSLSFDIRNPNRYVFVAAFDGTGQDATQALDSRTNVHGLYQKFDNFIHGDGQEGSQGFSRMHARYIEGPGTQDGRRENLTDQATGNSVQDRVFEMYKDLGDKTRQWKQENPNAEISVVTFGFSRGAVEAAEFAAVVGKFGIQAEIGYKTKPDDDVRTYKQTWSEWWRGERGSVAPEKEFKALSKELVAPGKVPIAAALFDPVATGVAENHERKLPSNISSALQLTAKDEHRVQFPVNRIVTDALTQSDPNRFANITVAGCHSDVGGGYADDKGLAQRSSNLMGTYFNKMLGQEVCKSQAPDEQRPVLHDSNTRFFQYLGYAQTGYWYADRAQDGATVQNGQHVRSGVDANTLSTKLDPVGVDRGGRSVDDSMLSYRSQVPSREQLRPDDGHMPRPHPEKHSLQDETLIGPQRQRVADTTGLMLESSARIATLMDRSTNPATAAVLHDKSDAVDARHDRFSIDESAQGRLSAAVALAAKNSGMDRIGEVALSPDRSTLVIVDRHDAHTRGIKSANVDIDTALRTPMNESLRGLALERAADNPKPESLYSQAYAVLQRSDLGRQHPDNLVEAASRIASQARHDGLTAINDVQVARGQDGNSTLVATQDSGGVQKQSTAVAVAQAFPNAQIAQPQQEQNPPRAHQLS